MVVSNPILQGGINAALGVCNQESLFLVACLILPLEHVRRRLEMAYV